MRCTHVAPSTPSASREGTPPQPSSVVRAAARVERLVYTRSQAAKALGISRSTFSRRVLPFVETIEMPWGTRLIPVDELERLLFERRRPPRYRSRPSAPRGRPAALAPDVVKRIRAERAAGKSLRRSLTSSTPARHPQRTAARHGGRRLCAPSCSAKLDAQCGTKPLRGSRRWVHRRARRGSPRRIEQRRGRPSIGSTVRCPDSPASARPDQARGPRTGAPDRASTRHRHA